MQPSTIAITVPPDLEFAELHLARSPNGGVLFRWPVIQRICAASQLPLALFREHPAAEEYLYGLIFRWYGMHRARGGAPDAVAEALIDWVRTQPEEARD